MERKLIMLIVFLTVFSFNSCKTEKEDREYHDIYGTLEKILIERKGSLKKYMKETQELAQSIRNDQHMINFFKAENAFYNLKDSNELPQKLTNEIEKLHYNIQQYYIMNYQNFYDILFINNQGDIFYTILHQKDFGKNIFKSDLTETKLSKKLKKMPKESFVDFQFYKISGEPSAFFIEPVIDNDKTIGWFVMQCAVNKINNLFTLNKNLGSTGEVVLVNRDHYMLTNSRFSVNPTILKQKLPEENIAWKFKKRKGRKNVVDYRGKEVFSVFEVFEFFDSEWLIIAKIDKSEIVTQKYLLNEEKYYQALKKSFKTSMYQSEYNPYEESSLYKVDIDEYGRNDTCGVITTQGVSTCTAVVINYPGHFSYIAHISPYDVVYNQKRTDLLAQVLKKILFFDITESEKQNLQFYIMSTQIKSVQNVTKRLLGNGFFLSQIKFAYNRDAKYGNIYSSCSDNNVVVEWILQDGESNRSYTNANSLESFEKIILENTDML